MQNFTYWNPTRIHFGEGQLAKLADEIPAGSKVMLLYGGGSIKQNGIYQQVMTQLKNYQVCEFAGIEPNPQYETLMRAVELGRQQQVTFLLAVGGGSVIDGTKFISAALKYAGKDPWQIVTGENDITDAVPFGAVLTLAATGSEANMGFVVTKNATREKIARLHPLLFPRFSILEVVATFSVPKKQIANGVVDAFVHVIEQYLTTNMNTPIQDRFAESLLLTLIENGPKALKNPHDYEVRANLMWAASLALQGLIGSGVQHDWATHMIGHELTAEYGLDHAETLAVVLPSVMTTMKAQKKEKILQYGERVWNITTGTEAERINLAIAETRSFFESLGVNTRLADYGVDTSRIPILIERLAAKGMVALGERQNISPQISQQILEMSV